MLGVVAMGKDEGAMRTILGSNFILCWTLNLHWYVLLGSSKNSQAAITELLLCRKSTGVILHDALGFALMCHLKTAKCEWLRSRANRHVRMFVKQPIRRLQCLLAVESKKMLQKLKPSTLYMMFQLTLIFFPHHAGMHSEMLYPNRRVWNLPRTNICEAASKKRLKHLLAAEINVYAQAKSQISTWYVLT